MAHEPYLPCRRNVEAFHRPSFSKSESWLGSIHAEAPPPTRTITCTLQYTAIFGRRYERQFALLSSSGFMYCLLLLVRASTSQIIEINTRNLHTAHTSHLSRICLHTFESTHCILHSEPRYSASISLSLFLKKSSMTFWLQRLRCVLFSLATDPTRSELRKTSSSSRVFMILISTVWRSRIPPCRIK